MDDYERKEFEKKYSKQYKLKNYENEKIYDRDAKYNLNVFLTPHNEVVNWNGKLLSEICAEHENWNFKKGFAGLTGLERSVIIARMTGFSYQQISRTAKKSIYLCKQEFNAGIDKIVNNNLKRCNTCKLRQKLNNKKRSDKCSVWKIKTKNEFYCFLHRSK